MKKIPNFIYKDQLYYYLNNTIVDENFVEVAPIIKKEAGNYYFSKFNYKKMNYKQIHHFIEKLQILNFNELLIKIIYYATLKFENIEEDAYNLLPIMLHSLRKLGKQSLCIKVFEQYRKRSPKYTTYATVFEAAAAAYFLNNLFLTSQYIMLSYNCDKHLASINIRVGMRWLYDKVRHPNKDINKYYDFIEEADLCASYFY